MNEAGDYEQAFDEMMKWKIEKYGSDMIKSWGYDVSKYVDDSGKKDYSGWIPVIALQNEGKLADAWEKMKVLPSFHEMMKKDPIQMQMLWDANENGDYQEAFVSLKNLQKS